MPDLVTVNFADLPNVDQVQRPSHPPYSPLWRQFRYPLSKIAVLLWKDGTVKQVDSLYDPGFLTCDDKILGGYDWSTPDDSWQAQVMADAGYTLVAYERPSA